MIEIHELVKAVHLRIHVLHELFVLGVKQVGEGGEQGVLAVEIVVERAFGCFGTLDDFLDCCPLISFFVK